MSKKQTTYTATTEVGTFTKSTSRAVAVVVVGLSDGVWIPLGFSSSIPAAVTMGNIYRVGFAGNEVHEQRIYTLDGVRVG
jgi:hypothetical protein